MLSKFRNYLLPSENRFRKITLAPTLILPLSTRLSMVACNTKTIPGSSDSQSFFLEASSPSYGLTHMIQYLNQIESILQSSPESTPAVSYQHCYLSNDTKPFFKVIGKALAKPMLRTLIYGDMSTDKNGSKKMKIHFDQRIRQARISIEEEKMYSFVLNSLRPATLALDTDVRNEIIPNLLDKINAIESNGTNDNILHPRSTVSASFSRLASGRRYKGRLESLIIDLFPSELLHEFRMASKTASERDVFEFVINNDLVNKQKLEHSDGWTEKRIDAAFKCLSRFYPAESPSASEKQPDSENRMQSGKIVEEGCVTFLRNGGAGAEQTILQNVYVNARRNGVRSTKYVPPRPKPILDRSGIIWTDAVSLGGLARDRLCSEFDAIVLPTKMADTVNGDSNKSNNSTFIWEAKKTISPSTLHDIFSKKLGAIEALLDDQNAELIYMDGDTSVTIPFSAEGDRLTFGIYGNELQRPDHAADSIRSIAGSYVVSSNVKEIVRAFNRDDDADNIMVEVELASALNIIQRLKCVVEEIQNHNRVDVVIFLEESVDFL